jgi:hypothetical protein
VSAPKVSPSSLDQSGLERVDLDWYGGDFVSRQISTYTSKLLSKSLGSKGSLECTSAASFRARDVFKIFYPSTTVDLGNAGKKNHSSNINSSSLAVK